MQFATFVLPGLVLVFKCVAVIYAWDARIIVKHGEVLFDAQILHLRGLSLDMRFLSLNSLVGFLALLSYRSSNCWISKLFATC
jgi:hypothetical protein